MNLEVKLLVDRLDRTEVEVDVVAVGVICDSTGWLNNFDRPVELIICASVDAIKHSKSEIGERLLGAKSYPEGPSKLVAVIPTEILGGRGGEHGIS